MTETHMTAEAVPDLTYTPGRDIAHGDGAGRVGIIWYIDCAFLERMDGTGQPSQ